MHRHDKVETILYTLHEQFAVINLDVEFILDCIVHHNTCFDIDFIILIVPVGLESDWNTIPPIGIDMTKSVSTNFNYSLGKHVRFLLQMVMVLVRVVECSESNWCKTSQLNLFLHCLETLLHHFSLSIINYILESPEGFWGFGVLGFWDSFC